MAHEPMPAGMRGSPGEPSRHRERRALLWMYLRECWQPLWHLAVTVVGFWLLGMLIRALVLKVAHG